MVMQHQNVQPILGSYMMMSGLEEKLSMDMGRLNEALEYFTKALYTTLDINL